MCSTAAPLLVSHVHIDQTLFSCFLAHRHHELFQSYGSPADIRHYSHNCPNYQAKSRLWHESARSTFGTLQQMQSRNLGRSREVEMWSDLPCRYPRHLGTMETAFLLGTAALSGMETRTLLSPRHILASKFWPHLQILWQFSFIVWPEILFSANHIFDTCSHSFVAWLTNKRSYLASMRLPICPDGFMEAPHQAIHILNIARIRLSSKVPSDVQGHCTFMGTLSLIHI